MPFPSEVPLSHILDMELLEGGASYSLNRILAWPEGGMSQVLKVYFFGTKRTFDLDKRASSFHNGESGGVFGAPGPHSPYPNPCMSTLYSI